VRTAAEVRGTIFFYIYLHAGIRESRSTRSGRNLVHNTAGSAGGLRQKHNARTNSPHYPHYNDQATYLTSFTFAFFGRAIIVGGTPLSRWVEMRVIIVKPYRTLETTHPLTHSPTHPPTHLPPVCVVTRTIGYPLCTWRSS